MMVVFVSLSFSVCNKQILRYVNKWTVSVGKYKNYCSTQDENKGILTGLTRILLEHWVRNSLDHVPRFLSC